ncbi:hypothetical protein DU500_13680 [Haloplanus rubicundus]|uniref:Cell division protein SepF n=1 Tax=Haloplanus rubicundus TaxID=1547898 RepID=A0A345E5B7_9EURY|nr:DUF5779 family protein [Haloplanus rubicundus]AXG07389.1 hypothetical protein DU500_13680 [Haloplanus rubicundus]AXG10805.1 hypothetical protein DU484_13655 [Haloplanus rubicundus]
MSEFDLDLRNAEEQLEDGDEDGGSEVVLGILDGGTDPDEWIGAVEDGKILVLNVEGDLNRLAAGFAREIRDAGGTLMRFRGFLVVTPPGVGIDTDRLSS